MKCMKNHPVLFLLLVPLLALFAVFSFGNSSTYATSVTCSWSVTDSVGQMAIPNTCDLSSLNGSTTYADGTILFDSGASTYTNQTQIFTFLDSSRSIPTYTDSTRWAVFNKNYSPTESVYQSIPVHIVLPFTTPKYAYAIATNSRMFTYTFDITFSDVAPTPDCPDCPDCPPIPENPYDNKLDEITHAIYACGATLIVLYFLFMIFKIIANSRGRV